MNVGIKTPIKQRLLVSTVIGAVTICFIILTFFVTKTYHDDHLEREDSSARGTILTLEKIITEEVLRNNFEAVQNIINVISINFHEVSNLECISPNGFTMKSMDKDRPTPFKKEYTKEIKFNDDHIYTLKLTWDLSFAMKEIERHRNALIAKLLLILFLITMVLLYSLRTFAIVPLKEEQNNRLRAEAELIQEKVRTEQILNFLPSAIISSSIDFKMIGINNMASQLIDEFKQSKERNYLFDLIPFLAPLREEIENSINNSQAKKIEKFEVSSEHRKKYYDISVYVLQTGSVDKTVVIKIDDVTNRVLRDSMLVHSEKMFSVGSMAAGMAHELNNPLSIILQGVQLWMNII